MPLLDNKKNIRSFGRINGRGVTEDTRNILEKKLEKYSFDANDLDNNGINYLEIGFGYGESLAERAKVEPQVNYFGCETYTKGVLNLINLIEKNNLKNVKIFNGDARLLLDSCDDDVFDMVCVPFPDPWPKKKQRKRRIISDDFLDVLKDKIRVGGKLFFASDIDDYINWTMEKVENNGYFAKNFDINNMIKEPNWWVKSKYQQKASAEGRISKFLEWVVKK